MNSIEAAGVLLAAGSLVFLAGAAIGVPGVFMEPTAEVRLRMIEERLVLWRAAQPLYALGPIVASIGVAVLAAGAPVDTAAEGAFWLAAAALLTGAFAWAWCTYARAVNIAEIAYGRLPGWPFAAYVLLTIAGLATMVVAFALSGTAVWLVAISVVADTLFLALYAATKDIPPFMFYLLLLFVGAVLVIAPQTLTS